MKVEKSQLLGFDPDGESGQGQESCWRPEPRHDIGLGDKTTDLPARESRTVGKGECSPP